MRRRVKVRHAEQGGLPRGRGNQAEVKSERAWQKEQQNRPRELVPSAQEVSRRGAGTEHGTGCHRASQAV